MIGMPDDWMRHVFKARGAANTVRERDEQCPASEVRDTWRHPPDTNFASKGGTRQSMVLVPLFDLKFLCEFAQAL
jgi:hypothetical protein